MKEDSIAFDTMCTESTSSVESGYHANYMKGYPEHSVDGALRLGNICPDFEAQTTHGPMQFHKWKKGKWAILFSHPADFTPVCTTEIAELATKYEELTKLDYKIATLSVDSLDSHKHWVEDIIAQHVGEEISVEFPIIADENRVISEVYGMLDPFGTVDQKLPLTIRSVFIINPENKLMLSLNYPACIGRNMNEIVRCAKALQLSYKKSIATPCNWPENHAKVTMKDGTTSTEFKGGVFLLPSVTPEGAAKDYPDFYTVPVPSGRSYLRVVKVSDVGLVPQEDKEEDKTDGRSRSTVSTDTTVSESTVKSKVKKGSFSKLCNLSFKRKPGKNSVEC